MRRVRRWRPRAWALWAGWLWVMGAGGLASGWVRADGDCPLEAQARAAYPRRVLATGESPWGLRPLPPVPESLPPAALPPSGSADRRRMIRRLTFLITGLPPRADDAGAFVNDRSARALEKVIDRLQGAPAASERLAQWWLGVVGYADHWTGVPVESPQPLHAWRYRDWVIEAMEKSTPLRQWVRLHLIGDTLPPPEPGIPHRQGLTATTWYLFGPPPQGDFVTATAIRVRLQADRTARIFLGTEFSCARCHDHPAVPLPVADAAAWDAYFTGHFPLVPGLDGSPVPTEVPTASDKRLAQRERELAAINRLESELGERHQQFAIDAVTEFLPQTAEYVRAAWAWHRQSPETRGSIEESASRRGLLAAPLGRWVAVLGLTAAPSSALAEPWWNQWVAARESGDSRRIAEASHAIEAAHTASPSSPFFDLSPPARQYFTLDQQTLLTKLEHRIATARRNLTSAQLVHAVAKGPLPGVPPHPPSSRSPALLAPAPDSPAPAPADRLALAAWLDGPGRLLHSRVMAHRLWVACGQPPIIVHESDWWRPDPPAQAALLDALASVLHAADGNFPSLQRAILLAAPAGLPIALTESDRRDAVLFVSGQLDPRRPGAPDASVESPRRTLFRVWTEPPSHPPLVGAFLEAQARATIALAAEKSAASPAAQTDWLTHRLLQRPPTAQEQAELGLAPDRDALVAFCLTLFQSDEFRILR